MPAKISQVELGLGSSGAEGLVPADSTILALNGQQVSRRFDRVLAIVEGPEWAVEQARDVISSAFARGGPADAVARGSELEYVQDVVARVVKPGLQRRAKNRRPVPDEPPPIAFSMAAYAADRVFLTAFAGARGQICRANGDFDESDAGAGGVQAVRLAAGDSVVLVGKEVAAHVTPLEIRQTVQASFSVERAAKWLVTLARGRTGGVSTAIVARVPVDARLPAAMAVPTELGRLGPYVPKPRARTLALGGMVALALLAGVYFGPALLAGGAAVQLQAPTNLRTVILHPRHVLLSWKDPNGGASTYVLKVGNRFFRSRYTYLAINNRLVPGHSYIWRVQSVLRNQTTNFSAPRLLTVPHLNRTVHVTALSPTGQVPAKDAGAVNFCWVSRPAITDFGFDFSGGGNHFNGRVTAHQPEAHVGQHGAFCVTVALTPRGHYSWRVAPIVDGGQPGWSGWQHFDISTGKSSSQPNNFAETTGTSSL